MSFIQSLLSGGASKVIDSIGNVVDKVTTTKEEKMQLENEMKKAQQQFDLEMAKLSVQEQAQIFGDIDSARTMGTKVQESPNATKLAKNIAPYLALGATILAFGMLYIVVFDSGLFNDKNKEMVMYVLGVVSTLLAQVYGYYFGSSAGSKDKNDMLRQQMQQANT